MSGCHLCNFTGLVVTCEEPMAGPAGFSSEPCSCAMKPCPRGLCDGSGLLAPHPATSSADAGLDDPCPCRDVAPVSTRTAAWTESDRLEATLDAAIAEASRLTTLAEAAQAASERAADAHYAAWKVALAIGPRPAKEPAECSHCKRPADAISHVPGCIFVGFGYGWQPCVHCGGSSKVPS